MVAVSAMTRAIARALRCRWRAASLAALAVLALDIALPPLVLSVVRGPWTYFTFNPWLARAPEYLVSDRPWTEKLDFLSRVALVWVSADGPYGQPEWGFAVDGADLARFVVTAALVATFVALWLERGAAGAPVPAARGGTTVGAIASVLGLSTGPCSVVGCGAPVLPVVGLAFAGLSSTTLALLSQVSRVSAIVVMVTLLVAVAWLGRQAGRRPAASLGHSVVAHTDDDPNERRDSTAAAMLPQSPPNGIADAYRPRRASLDRVMRSASRILRPFTRTTARGRPGRGAGSSRANEEHHDAD